MDVKKLLTDSIAAFVFLTLWALAISGLHKLGLSYFALAIAAGCAVPLVFVRQAARLSSPRQRLALEPGQPLSEKNRPQSLGTRSSPA